MSEKPRKPFYKRWWFIALVFVVIIGVLGSNGDDESKDFAKEPIEQADVTVENEIEGLVEEEPAVKESDKDDVPREYRNALRSAQNYVDIMPFSEQGLFDQLTSEHGDQYPAEAAQYAIENVKVDYNKEALEAAKNYLAIMPMSDQELFNQLTSEHGDKYTEEQAQYAIDNLPD